MSNKAKFNYQTKHQEIINTIQTTLRKQQGKIQNLIAQTQNKNIYEKIEQDYLKYSSHHPLPYNCEIPYQMLAYSQQYFVIDMFDQLFPIEIYLKNIKGNFTLLVGYDKKYPTQRITQRLYTLSNSQSTPYDYKFEITQETVITLKNHTNRFVSKIYLSIITKKKFSIFTFLIRNSKKQPQKHYQKGQILPSKKRILTESSDKSAVMELNDKVYLKKLAEYKRNRVQSLQSMPRIKNQQQNNNSLEIMNQRIDNLSKKSRRQLPSLQKLNNKSVDSKVKQPIIRKDALTQKQPSKELLKIKNAQKNTVIEKEKQHTRESIQKNLIAKNKKNNLQILKQKERQFKQISAQFKSSIIEYEVVHKKQSLKKKKMNTLVSPLIYILKFLKQTNQTYQAKERSIVKSWRVNYITIKFVRKIKRRIINVKKYIPYFTKRLLMGTFDITKCNAKMSNQFCINNGAKLIYNLFTILTPGLTINKVFSQSNLYRSKVIYIQRYWKAKYHARLQMIQYCGKSHVQKMLLAYEHFYKVLGEFKLSNSNHILCYDYIKDSSIKYQNIFAEYLFILQERQQFIRMNEEIRKYNQKFKTKPKQYLSIIAKPNKPIHRFFRDLDILKAMLRNWFEMQYKKWEKIHKL